MLAGTLTPQPHISDHRKCEFNPKERPITTQDFTNGRRSMREEIAAFVESTAGEKPCDCISLEDGFHRSRCQCQNYDDNGRAASWCSDMNTAVAIRSIPEYVEIHDSDCATHNMPAYPNGPCDCSAAVHRS